MPATLPRRRPFFPLTASLLLSSSLLCAAQTSVPATNAIHSTDFNSLPDAPQPQKDAAAPLPPPPKPEPITLAGTPKRILLDQKAIWTSPLHIRPVDAFWLLPLGSRHRHHDRQRPAHHERSDPYQRQRSESFQDLSDAGVGALAVMPTAMYVWSLNHEAPAGPRNRHSQRRSGCR